MTPELSAAVIGASGIGKHHAKWFHRLGCSLDAIAGTSTESAAATGENLRDMFGFDGEGYASVQDMLGAGRYDLISVCSPEKFHYDHFMRAIDHGAHVLCEKPLVFDPDLSDELILQRAPETFFMQMESRGGEEGTDFEQIFVDLGSHPLSVLMGFCGPGEMVERTASCTVEQKCVEARFDYEMECGGTCRAHIVCRNRPEGDLVRRFGINDRLVDYEGGNDDEGVYRAYLTYEDDESCHQDFMETSLERFVAAVRGDADRPLATAAEGLQNLRIQLTLLEIGQRTRT
jgi:predicted dehydrogenase